MYLKRAKIEGPACVRLHDVPKPVSFVLWLVLCDTWNCSDDNDTVLGIAILDTTAIPEMRYAISMFFRNRQSRTLVVTEMCVCSSVCTLTIRL